MAHELYTRTNQKIYFAGLSLEALAQRRTRPGDECLGADPGRSENRRCFTSTAPCWACVTRSPVSIVCPRPMLPRAESLLTREVLETIADS